MGLLFGVSPSEREHAVATVRSLRISSLAGVAAALSWSDRRADRVLREAVRTEPERIAYNPATGQVRWKDPPVAAPASVPESLRPAPPTPAAAPTVNPVVVSDGGTPRWMQGARCPSCHVALSPSGTAGLSVCSKCGRLTHVGGGAQIATGTKPSLPAPAAATAPASAPTFSDRRSQELLAAWVTSQPIPCPKCRTPLRHRGVSEYSCPSCGQRVNFPKTMAGASAAAGPQGPSGPAPQAAVTPR